MSAIIRPARVTDVPLLASLGEALYEIEHRYEPLLIAANEASQATFRRAGFVPHHLTYVQENNSGLASK